MKNKWLLRGQYGGNIIRNLKESMLRTVNEEFYFIIAINPLGAPHFSRWRATGKYSNKTKETERERERERARAREKLGHISIRLGIIVDIRCRAKLFPIFAGEEDRRASHENFLLSKIAGVSRPVDFYVAHKPLITVLYISLSLSSTG